MEKLDDPRFSAPPDPHGLQALDGNTFAMFHQCFYPTSMKARHEQS
jgi:hypothetical protein